MHRLTSLSLRQRSVVVLATILIAFAGIFGVTRLKTELFPSIEFPVLTVVTNYPGASPGAVDEAVSQQIESAVQALSGVTSVQTQSSEGFSVVVAEFDFGADMQSREQELSTTLDGVALPEGATHPDVQRISFDQFPVVQLSLVGADGDLAALRQIAEERFVPALTSADGVSRVEITGGAENALLISLDPARMAETGVTPQQVAGVLQANNLSTPAGAVQSGAETLPVRVVHQFGSIAEVEALVVGARPGADGQPVTLGEVATVEVAPAGAPGISRTDGEPSLALDVYMTQGGNTVDTAAAVRDELDEIEENLAAANLDVSVITVFDQSDYIQESIDGLIREAGLGAVFAVVVIFAFLLSFRSTLVTAVSIPSSVLVAFILLWWQGISLNIMTLGGLAVAVGRVVDDAIVVLESIYRHVQRGEDTRKAVLEGTKEVALAITASTITTIAVFLPLGLVGGIIGEIFLPFALTVTFALLASLLVALTIVPVLASYLIKTGKVRALTGNDSRLQRVYVPVLRWSLRRPLVTLAIAGLLFVGSLGLVPFIGTSFLPAGGEKVASIEVDMPPGSSQEATVARAADLEQVVRDSAEVELLQTQIGGDNLQAIFSGATNSRAIMTVQLDADVDLNDTLNDLRDALGAVAGDAQITVSDGSGGFGGGNAVAVTVQGDDYGAVSGAATQLTERIAGVEDLVNVENDVVESKPEIVVTVDPASAAAAGTTPAEVADQVRQALAGTAAGQVSVEGVSYPARVVVTGAATDIEALRQLPVGTTGTPLGEVAAVEEASGAVQVVRIDGDRAATVSGTIATDETGAVSQDVQAIVDDFAAPEGVEVNIGGVSADQSEAFASMGVALLVAIGLVYLAMVASFGSLSTPFVILFSLPVAVIGVMAALFLSGKSLGLPALIGVLMLVGIVVTNAIVLLEFVIELRKRGLPLVEALIEGGKTRLRPILMTAIATILALTPLALSPNTGSIIASDLAVVVIGGLITSTLLTLVVVPVVYKLIAGWLERRAARSVPAVIAQPVAADD